MTAHRKAGPGRDRQPDEPDERRHRRRDELAAPRPDAIRDERQGHRRHEPERDEGGDELGGIGLGPAQVHVDGRQPGRDPVEDDGLEAEQQAQHPAGRMRPGDVRRHDLALDGSVVRREDQPDRRATRRPATDISASDRRQSPSGPARATARPAAPSDPTTRPVA